MSWKSSLLAALVVVAAGLGTGVALGGKTKTVTNTITVTHQKTVSHTVTLTTTTPGTTTTVTAPASTSTGSGGTTSTPSIGTGSGSNKSYYATYLNSQQTGSNSQQASLDNDPSSLELNGNTYTHAIAFDFDLGACCQTQPTDTYQLPVPGFSYFSSPLAGLVTSDSASAGYKLTIYKNNDNPGAVVLYSGTFTGPSGVHPVRFSTQGATDLLLVWTNNSYAMKNQDSDTFVFADPVVTSAK